MFYYGLHCAVHSKTLMSFSICYNSLCLGTILYNSLMKSRNNKVKKPISSLGKLYASSKTIWECGCGCFSKYYSFQNALKWYFLFF